MGDMNYSFSLMTINVRGLNERKKRRSVFRWIKQNKVDICLIQESYSSPEVENIWSNEWGRKIIFSHGTRHGRGVMILLKPGLDIEIGNTLKDNIGRLLLLDAKIQDTPFKICNIYAPNNEDSQLQFYNHLNNLLTLHLNKEDKIIIGGDFNVIFNPALDRKANIPYQASRKYNQINACIKEIQLNLETHDIWRIKNPDNTRYTWSRQNPTKIKSRLDYLLTSETLLDNIQDVDIIPCIKSDHSAVILKLNNFETREKGKGHWKLNTSFINEEDYIKGIIENKIKWTEEFQDVKEGEMKWELFKYKIRQFSMEYGRKKARKIANEEKDLTDKLKELELKRDSIKNDMEREMELDNLIAEIRNKLNEIDDYKTKGLIMRSHVRWYEKGEKSNDYFLRLENRNKIKKNIKKLKRADDSYTTDQTEILSMQSEFYEKLYASQSNKSNDEIKQYLNKIKTPILNEEEKQEGEGLLTVKECLDSIKSFKKNKTPGNDGLPIEFYAKFWPIFGNQVVDSFNASYVKGEMSTSQRQAVITLLDKGKDRSLLKNWRPISLLNVDYKIASKTIANRLIKHLTKLIHPNQVGYVKNRKITDNIRTVIDIMEHLKEDKLPGILINIDFEKAFDSIDWTFLKLVLNKFNFGNSLTKWIQTFYTNLSSCVINNGFTSKYFPVERGVRQGDALSPYLFILCAEILSSSIRQNENIEGINLQQSQLKLLQYADDTNGILKDRKSAKHFLQTVDEFGQFSGLKLNKEKTEGMWLGSSRDKKSKPLGIRWPDEPLRMLGVYISYDSEICKQKNFKDKLLKMKSIINMWAGRNLTLIGRAQIIKTFIISQLLYVSSALDVPEDIIKEVDKLIFKFIWNNKKAKLRKSVLKRDIREGGLKIPDFKTMLQASRIKWVSRLFETSEKEWPPLLSKYLEKSEIHLNTLLHSNFDIKSLYIKPGTLPPFYLKLLEIWSVVGEHTHGKNTFLWYNRNIVINKKSLYYKDYFEAGAWYIHDLYKEDGSLIPFNDWVNRGVSKSSMIRWMSLIRLTRRLQNTTENPNREDITPCQPLIKIDDTHIPLSQCHINTSKIYTNLLKRQYYDEIHIPRTDKYLDIPNIGNWTKAYIRANKYPIDTKMKEFQFKFIHDILANRYWLKKWTIVDKDECQICKLDIDNIIHIYWECPTTKLFWSKFTEWYQSKLGHLELNIQDVFLGCENELLCCLLFIGKRHIYLNRLTDEAPNFKTYLIYVKSVRGIELYCAKQNNKVECFLNKWQNII